MVDGLRIYFDFTLPTLLLYNFERDQYRTVMKIPSDDSVSSEQHSLTPSRRETGTVDEDRNGFVSSSTEPVSSTSKVITVNAQSQNDSSENTEESKFPVLKIIKFR